MTWVDLAVLGVLVVSGLLAFMRGLVREVLGIGAWIGAGIAAVWCMPYARRFASEWIKGPEFVDPAAFLGVFVVALIILSVVAHIVSGLVRKSALGGVDRTLGLVFGLLRGAALVIIAYILASAAIPLGQWPEPVLEARSLPPAYVGARWVIERLPDGFRPRLDPPPMGRQTTAEALLRATPQGRATGKPPVRE